MDENTQTVLELDKDGYLLLHYVDDYQESLKEYPEDIGTFIRAFNAKETSLFIKFLFESGVKEPSYVESAEEMEEELYGTQDSIILFNHRDTIGTEEIINHIRR